MPKEAFGGDDEGGGGAPDKRKLGLGRFGLSPDQNIRDVFWRVMGGYAAAKKPGEDLGKLGNDRFALMRAALAILSTSHSERYGLAPRFIAVYSIMMMADGGWGDALSEFLVRSCEERLGIRKEVSHAIRKLLAQEPYGRAITQALSAMARGRESTAAAMGLIADAGSRELALAMKKELMIIARGDIGQSQLDAIRAVSLIKDDAEARKSLIILLSHWDAGARLAAAGVLATLVGDEEVSSAARRRLDSETDDGVKKLLKRIAK